MNRITPIAALLLGAGVAGCSTMQSEPMAYATVAEVVNEVQCQIWREIAAADAQSLWSGYRAKMALTVIVSYGAETYGGVGVNLGFIRIGPYFDHDRSLSQIVELPEVSFNVSELAALDCSTPPAFQIANMSGTGLFSSLFSFAAGNGGGGVGRISDTFSLTTGFGLWKYGSVYAYTNLSPVNGNIRRNNNTSDVHTAIIVFTRNTAGADARLNAVIADERERAEDSSSGSSGSLA